MACIEKVSIQLKDLVAVTTDVSIIHTRYDLGILDGLKNPWRLSVMQELSAALLKEKAQDGKPAKYWPKDTQERNLQEVFEKYLKKKGVWNESAMQVSVCMLSELLCTHLQARHS